MPINKAENVYNVHVVQGINAYIHSNICIFIYIFIYAYISSYILNLVYVINVHLFPVLTNRINGRYAELPRGDMFYKMSTIAHRLREIYGHYSAVFSHHNLQKTPWSAQGQFDGRRLTPAQFGHDEDESDRYGNSSTSSRLLPGGAALGGPRHSKVNFCTSVCKL